jgi:hypothetical protein
MSGHSLTTGYCILIPFLFRMNAFAVKFMVMVAACLLLASCAQVGPPLPPSLELPKAPVDLHATRKGDRVTLTWSQPTLTTHRQSIRYLGPTRICRSVGAELNECDTPIASVPVLPSQAAPPPQSTSHQKHASVPTQVYVDTLPATALAASTTAEVTYAVEVMNRDARSAGLSNKVTVPAVSTPPPPADLKADLTGDGVALTWTSAGESENTPGIQHRYRIYRRDESNGKDSIAGETSVGESGGAHLLDGGLVWEHTYLYRVTAVTAVNRAGSELQVEGDDSSTVRVIAHDVFPPAVPMGLQAVYSGEGQKPFVDLIWTPVANPDLAGYNVYRSESNGTAVKLNSELAKTPAYRDAAVASGKTYTYSISAVDVRGNESAHSELASETVP